MGALDDKVALVTGAARGIGRGVAHALLEAGANVVLTDIDSDAVSRAARELGGKAAAERMDVRDPEEVERVVDRIIEHHGQLDILVANAGRTDRRPFLEMEVDFFREISRVNLEGVFISCQAAARRMVAAGGGGRIVTVSSNSGRFGGRGRAAYSPSKAGIIALTQTMAVELAEHGILVNSVAPGPIRTEATHEEVPGDAFTCRMSLKRFGKPSEVGAAVVFLASDACSFTTGHILCVDGGLTATGVMEG